MNDTLKMTELIADKRNGKAHSGADVEFILAGIQSGSIKDYQLTAWLMAVYLKGMTIDEIAVLTDGMSRSGAVLDLSAIGPVVCDKHSTGGVGDKTTLVLVPLLAAAGLPMAKLSGRGLAHTGGTLDKLEAIPGFNVSLTEKGFVEQVQAIGAAIGSTTADFAPADGKLYGLRNETATIDSIALGSASVMCKKLAAGANLIILDVKCGVGAFMDTRERAHDIASTMVEIGRRLGKQVVAVITNMDQPLGYAVGHALEVAESIETLQGHGAPDLRALCLYLGAIALVRSGKFTDEEQAQARLAELLDNGAALEKFRQIIIHQGGDGAVIERPELLPQSRVSSQLLAAVTTPAYVKTVDAMAIALSSKQLAAYGSGKLNLATGVRLHLKVGDRVASGQPVATIYADSKADLDQAMTAIGAAIAYSPVPVAKPALILERID